MTADAPGSTDAAGSAGATASATAVVRPRPAPRLAVIACMDSRVTVEELLDISAGEAHIIRNAGGLATDDALRSLVISQRLLGTREVVVIEHTECGMLSFRDEEARERLVDETGVAVDLPFLAFDDLEANLRHQVDRITAHPWTLDVPLRGLIYELASGRLRQIV